MTTETRIKFVAVIGAHLSDGAAQRYGEELYRLYTEEQLALTAENVIGEAREAESPLHDYFEWNNREAADQYRLHQARKMLHSIAFLVQDSEEVEPESLRFFGALPQEDVEEVGMAYIPMTVIMETPDLKVKLLRIAARELASFRRKYGRLKRLNSIIVWAELDALLEETA
jgi:hypothetical protein